MISALPDRSAPLLFEWLTNEVTGNPATYALVFAAAAGDVLFPLIPSETIVIAAAVIAAQGGLLIFLIVPAAALGAFLGDNIAYWLGRKVGDPISRRLFRGDKGKERLEWAQRAVRKRGGSLIVLGRFIPGGRTATTFAAGTLELDYRHRFLPADVLAAVLWALYISLLGYIGGETFKDNLLIPLAIALGVATLVTVGFEVFRHLKKRHGEDPFGG